ncbi:cAMP-binding protein [Dokdonia pacifica]|uniref:cAMP-binding domain of CRP or a regulatory subunit of cAMP-dependent protein kinases n=1 Tax=Dokdonia pacifica TaxID=1627892 RepID=A0A239DD34_9FLAO|nr:Crp/Fnr family transcriptional regulator [Dokdonia pacifica]GGG39889.1 cAMP-binding protein [Dokdonia pacifica]SNS30295.1 cAMP-binding domain of CRP or a regulatory subunit of cAMP-dependent protein kinases [Dokdonia pacifica]
MQQLKDCITKHVSVQNETLETIVSFFEPVTVSKGTFLLESGSISNQLIFIASGYLRMYDISDGKEITLWIGSQGKFITSVSSFVFQTSNYWNITAITNAEVYILSRKDHFNLCQSQPKWLEFDNLLLASSFALLEQKMFSHLHTTAKQRFEKLFQEEPSLFNHVPLQYIASMLGITPESLSRLRKGLGSNS